MELIFDQSDCFPVIINVAYGGGGIHTTDEIDALYFEETGKNYDYDREDVVMAKLIETNECVGKYFCMQVIYIENKYKGCYTIQEYDGSESVSVSIDKYKIKLVKELEDFTKENVVKILDMKLRRIPVYSKGECGMLITHRFFT